MANLKLWDARPPLLICGILMVMLIVACGREDVGQGKPQAMAETPKVESEPVKTKAAPMSGEWKLIAIDRTQLQGGMSPSIFFGEEGLCWGNTGINDFRTRFSIGELNRLEVGKASVTRKMGPPEAMAVERLFLERLQTAISFEVSGDLLYVNSGANQNVTFERVYTETDGQAIR